VKEQIAFADVILLNKTDLVEPAELDRLEARIKAMNAAAKVHHTHDARVDMDHILDMGGFNLDRALEVDPQFLEPEYPFEWGGVYRLDAGAYEFALEAGPDPAMNVALVPCPAADWAGLEAVLMDAVLAFSDDERPLPAGRELRPGKALTQLQLGEAGAVFRVAVPAAGCYALFTEHHPDEFRAELRGPAGPLAPAAAHAFKPDHEHDEEVTSVGITIPGDLNAKKLNAWMQKLLMERGTDIFRMKGVLSIKGDDKRFVFQGVHMLFDGRPDRPWGAEPRANKLIFIGRNLDRAALTEGFRSCLA
jgi:G3E family GTPase